MGCDGLREIIIPSSVQTVGRYAFENCNNLSVTVLGKALAADGWDVFWVDQNAAVQWNP